MDPCLNSTCPLYPSAVCLSDNCNQTCQPSFFHKHNLHKEITHLCNATSCSGIVCPKNRVCMEEMVPIACHHRRRRCDHFIRQRCFPKPLKTLPTNCSVIECPANTDCVTTYVSTGTQVKCVPNNDQPAKKCSELACNKGMVCKVKAGIAQCVPKHFRKTPHDCSGVKCEEGFICAMIGKSHKPHCIKESFPPKSCSELNCQALKMSCQQNDDGAAVCVSIG